MKIRTPAAVLLGATEMGLATGRSLAPRGIPVFALHFVNQRPAAGYSRFLKFVQGPDYTDESAVLNFVCNFASHFAEKPVLMYGSDESVMFMHRHRARLQEHYRFYVWDSERLPEIDSKSGLIRVAEHYSLPLPETYTYSSGRAFDWQKQTLNFPCIAKPEFTGQWETPQAEALGLGIGRGNKAIVANNVAELRDICERSERVGARCVIQRLIVGQDSNHLSYAAFVLPNGSIGGEFVARKLRVHPPHSGMGCYVEAAFVADAVALGRQILERLNYRGFASLQFKRDERDGRLYLMEINLRFPIWVGLPIACGCDFPYYYYQTSLGCSISKAETVALGKRWINVGQDFYSTRTYVKEKTVTWRQWVADLLRGPVLAYFRWNDPLPGIVASWRMLSGMASRHLKKMTRDHVSNVGQ